MSEEKPQVCEKCKNFLLVHGIYVFGDFHEIARYCDKKDCERYLVLVAPLD